jgi:hypothetical protein
MPFIQCDRGILKDRSDLETELFLADKAKPDAPGFDEGL